MASTNTVMADDSNQQQQPVVIRQGGNGIGLVLAALIVAGAAVYAVNVWSTTKKETAPGKTCKGIERIRKALARRSSNASSDQPLANVCCFFPLAWAFTAWAASSARKSPSERPTADGTGL